MVRRLREAISPYVVYVGIETVVSFAIALAYTTSIVYRVRDGHLSPLQLVLLGTIVESAYFVAQLPAGVFADTVSRRLSVILGIVLTPVGMLMQGLSADFAVLGTAQIPVGVGAALSFGAQEAWLADESGTDELTSVFLRATQLSVVGALLGSALSGLTASGDLALPFLVGGAIVGALGVALVVIMPEQHFSPPPRQAHHGALRQGWSTLAAQTSSTRTAMVAVPALLLVMGMTFFVGMWGESFDRLWGDYLLSDIRFPDVLGLGVLGWFSVIAVAASLLSLVGTEVARLRTDRLGPSSVVGSLLGLTVVTAAAVIGMTVARTFGAVVAAYLVVATVRPLYSPLTAGWLVARVPPEVRATALSAVDLFDSGGQLIGGPGIGAVGSLASVRLALLAGAAALAPAAGLLLTATRRLRARSQGAADVGNSAAEGPQPTSPPLPGPDPAVGARDPLT